MQTTDRSRHFEVLLLLGLGLVACDQGSKQTLFQQGDPPNDPAWTCGEACEVACRSTCDRYAECAISDAESTDLCSRVDTDGFGMVQGACVERCTQDPNLADRFQMAPKMMDGASCADVVDFVGRSDPMLAEACGGTGTPPPTCLVDELEPNDQLAAATLVTAGSYPELVSCAGDSDFFKVRLEEGETLTVQISFAHAEGDLDLYLYGPDGSRIETSAGASDGEILSHVAASGGMYGFEVRLASDAGAQPGNGYHLRVQVAGTLPPTPGEVCTADTMEPNDTRASAAAIGPNTFDGLTACGGEDDYFSIQLSARQEVTVQITFDHAEGDLNLELQHGTGVTLRRSASSTDDESVSFTAAEAGTYFVRVNLAEDGGDLAGNAYRMSVTVRSAPPPPPSAQCVADAYESNDTTAAAAMVSAGAYAGLVACDSDDDFYRISLSDGDEIGVGLAFDHGEGNINLELLDAAGSTVESANSFSDDESLLYTVPATGDYFIRVHLVLDTGNVPGNTYDMSVSVASPPPPMPALCPADPFEPNDSVAEAPSVSTGSILGLSACGGDDDYYAVQLGAGDEITASLSFDHSEGDVDLRLLSGSGTPLRTSASSTNDEQITYAVPVSDTYYLRVNLFADLGSDPGNAYTMQVTVVAAPPPVPNCNTDSLEPNNSQSNAPLIFGGTYPSLTACSSSDDDFYDVYLSNGEQLTVNLDFVDAEGDLDLEILDATGAIVASSASSTDDEQVVYTASSWGTYTVRVFLYSDAGNTPGNTYDMTLGTTQTACTMGQNDLPSSRNGWSCAGYSEEFWRCAWSVRFLQPISQVCRTGVWQTYHLNPACCGQCEGYYSNSCE